MGAKMRQRVRMFGSETDELHALVSSDVLPAEDFGGGHEDNGGSGLLHSHHMSTQGDLYTFIRNVYR